MQVSVRHIKENDSLAIVSGDEQLTIGRNHDWSTVSSKEKTFISKILKDMAANESDPRSQLAQFIARDISATQE